MPALFQEPNRTTLQKQFTLRQEVQRRFGPQGFEQKGKRIQYQVLVQLAAIPDRKSRVRKQARRALNIYGRWNHKGRKK